VEVTNWSAGPNPAVSELVLYRQGLNKLSEHHCSKHGSVRVRNVPINRVATGYVGIMGDLSRQIHQLSSEEMQIL
jgi:hypothetical protein